MSLAVTPAGTRAPAVVSTHYPLFDYLRIVLAVGVFFTHAFAGVHLPWQVGNACVQVFFSLSGFLIGTILLHTRRENLPRFYFNRVVRIWIPYGIAVALLMAVTIAVQNLRDPLLWQSAFYNVTFVLNVFHLPDNLQFRAPMWGSAPHFWSICVEEQFYLLAPLVIVFVPRARVPLLVAITLLNVFVPHDFAAVSLGVLLALVMARRPLGPAVRAVSGVAAVFFAVMVIRGWVSYAIGAPLGAVACVAALARPGGKHALGTILGGMSYPFYLNHWISLWLRPKIKAIFGVEGIAMIAIALVITLSLSALHYALIDRRVLLERDRWYTPQRGMRAWIAGFALVLIGLIVGSYFQVANRSLGSS
jgi:peptidoglycan/LPS O-acetylase OafA/YrhL